MSPVILSATAAGRRSDIIGIVCVVIAAIGLSFKGVTTKLLFAEGLELATIQFIRMMLATPMFWVIAAFRHRHEGLFAIDSRGAIAAAGAGIFCYYLGGLGDFGSLQLIAVSVQRMLIFSYPAMVVMLEAAINRRPPNRREILAMALTYVGIFLVMGGLDPSELRANAIGAALALGAAFTFSVYILINQTWGRIIGSIRFTLFAQTGAAVAMAIHFVVLNDAHFGTITPRAWGLLAVLILLATCISWFAFSEGIRRVGAARAALISTIGPPATLLVAYVVLGETLTWVQLTGAAVIAAGVGVLEIRRPPSPTPVAVAGVSPASR